MIFDKSLTWKTHIKEAKVKSMKALNILKSLSRTKWSSDRHTLIKLHKSLVLSRLEYGDCVYASATAGLLKSLDSVHHQGVRLSSGAFRSSPVTSMLVDTNF